MTVQDNPLYTIDNSLYKMFDDDADGDDGDDDDGDDGDDGDDSLCFLICFHEAINAL